MTTPSNPRKRPNLDNMTDGVHSCEPTTPLKRRYEPFINCTPDKEIPLFVHSAEKGVPSYTNSLFDCFTNGGGLFGLSDTSPMALKKRTTPRLSRPVSIASILKFPRIPSAGKEATFSEPISLASALNYPTDLIPLTAEQRKLHTIQQLIAEKLRMMRRDKLVLLKSPKPTPHESEICLTVVEVANNDGTKSSDAATVNYTVLQEDASDSSDLFKLVLDKINKRTIANPRPTSPAAIARLQLTQKKNFEYAKQIEREVIEKMTTLRQENTEHRDNQSLYVMFVDGETSAAKQKELPKAPKKYDSDNERREQEFTDLFDTIFQKVSTDPSRRKMTNLNGCGQKLQFDEWQMEDEDRRNKILETKDQRERNLRFYPCTNLEELDTVTIGPNGTKISMDGFLKINWWQWPTGYCTKKLLPELFSKDTMATHSLWGANTENRVLNPDKIDDLVCLISDNKPAATVRDIHQAIMSKCFSHKMQSAQEGSAQQDDADEEPKIV